MKVRAAVAFEAGKPLEVTQVDLDGPKAGEVLIEIKATGICHTDEFTRSGADPEGLFPAILGHEGAGMVVEVGTGVKSLGCENSTAQLLPIQSWKRILPCVVCASKSGAVSLIARAITHLRPCGP